MRKSPQKCVSLAEHDLTTVVPFSRAFSIKALRCGVLITLQLVVQLQLLQP